LGIVHRGDEGEEREGREGVGRKVKGRGMGGREGIREKEAAEGERW